MNKRKQDYKLAYTDLKPFRVYQTPYAECLFFKKIDGKMFVSTNRKQYKKSTIYFMPNDKVFKEVAC